MGSDRDLGAIEELRLRAERSRQSGFALPMVASAEEAKALAHALARQIAALSGPERLLALAEIDHAYAALEGRLGRLSGELAENGRLLRAANDSGAACGAYTRGRGR